MRASYEKGVTDEFVIPAVITTQAAPGKPAAPRGVIRDDDAVIFFNFRADRARQITQALIEPGFDKIADPARPKNLVYVGMTQYEKTWPWLRYILAPEKLEHILANVFAELRIQEPARRGNGEIRARHLFFQWRRGKTVSRRRARRGPVAESCHLRSETGNVRGRRGRHGDSRDREGRFRRHHHELRERGHGRPFRQARSDDQGRAKRWTSSLGRIFQALRPRGGAWIITADHGNAETMIDPVTGGPHTYHTTNPVPFILVTADDHAATRSPAARCATSRPRCWASWTWPSPAK